jgi:hypothetical protein
MLRSCAHIIALTAMVAGLSNTAQAAEPEMLRLACQGTVRFERSEHQDERTEPYSMGMTVNLTARTVQGFGSEYPFKITNVNAGTIIFKDTDEHSTVLGHIDRVTGDLEAMIIWGGRDQQYYQMKCKPTQRMF